MKAFFLRRQHFLQEANYYVGFYLQKHFCYTIDNADTLIKIPFGCNSIAGIQIKINQEWNYLKLLDYFWFINKEGIPTEIELNYSLK